MVGGKGKKVLAQYYQGYGLLYYYALYLHSTKNILLEFVLIAMGTRSLAIAIHKKSSLQKYIVIQNFHANFLLAHWLFLGFLYTPSLFEDFLKIKAYF